ncbi:hypothetical protein [Tuberibacillus calidus]|uniref:hypothetical protein n=1 Tax=Tuberibacillus calidus TaxID=340097 RepID=UPI0004875022|nr:hypothetical protein [Tuberibacillus calidus]
MEKKKYYVRVGTGEVLPDPTLSEWEFEILATPQEVHELKDLLEMTDDEAFINYIKAHAPFQELEENIPYDKKLETVYRYLYELGTEETKAHIRSMGFIEQ